ncbi:FliH/SctL family protein [Sporofaciens musculi]|uniref:FliH/SctL family protein n=2 Tax=Sporofaciens musculi TaxID=2681861 RepID=UPI001FCB7C14|nr:FliH/SctL family protein [Sporofaciens musculi]
MKSLPRIVKEPEKKEDVKPYDFFAGFKLIEEPKEEDEDSEGDAEEDEENAVSVEEILEEARAQARQIINDARSQAEYLRDQGYREGQETGRQDGTREAYDEQRRLLDAEIQELQNNISEVIQSVSVEKEKLLEQYVDDLKRISLTVAEKVIQTSLQSSGDIVKRMILAATDKITKKQWAKIYITKCDTAVSMDVDTEFLDKLSKLSENIKIVTMDNGEEGTCIIELPDEIIDASVGTQLENIKDILNNVRV